MMSLIMKGHDLPATEVRRGVTDSRSDMPPCPLGSGVRLADALEEMELAGGWFRKFPAINIPPPKNMRRTMSKIIRLLGEG